MVASKQAERTSTNRLMSVRGPHATIRSVARMSAYQRRSGLDLLAARLFTDDPVRTFVAPTSAC